MGLKVVRHRTCVNWCAKRTSQPLHSPQGGTKPVEEGGLAGDCTTGAAAEGMHGHWSVCLHVSLLCFVQGTEEEMSDSEYFPHQQECVWIGQRSS